jgi:hypothetical protein
LTAIRGLGRRFTTLACKKAGVNVHKRCDACNYSFSLSFSLSLRRSCIPTSPESFRSAGELKPAEIDKVLDVIAKPEDYKVRQSRSMFKIARATFRI